MRTPLLFVFAAAAVCACSSPQQRQTPLFGDSLEAQQVFADDAESTLLRRDADGRLLPPMAASKPYQVPSPHGARSDEYYWLRDDTRSDPQMLAYLNAENAYQQAMMAHTEPLQEQLYQEMIGRIVADDASVPEFKNGWWYYRRFEAGGDYPIYARRRGSMDAPEQILLDGNALAQDHSYYQIGNYQVSPNGRLLAWVEDTVGRRQWQLRVRDLDDDTTALAAIDNVQTDIAWSADSGSVLYIEKDPQTLLGERVRRHRLGSDPASDELLFEETDSSFYLSLHNSRSDRYVMIESESTVSSETRVAAADDPELRFAVVYPRQRDHKYEIEDHRNSWVILSNWQAPNFRLLQVPMAQSGDRAAWRELVPHREDALVERFQVFTDFLAINEKVGGLSQLRVRPWSGAADQTISADESPYDFLLSDNPDPASATVRYEYSSLVTPKSVYDYAPASGQRTLLKRDPVPGYDATLYVSEFIHARSRDGKQIPVSLLRRRDLPIDGTAALLQYGYGSYGSTYEPRFDSNWVSLLDRGVVVAIAHIRGGQALGRAWYEDGRLLNKKNTFNDFIDVTRHLIERAYAAPNRVAATGGSAGGLLMGAVVNQDPKLYRAVVSRVPFVDVVTTMLDESIPLTTNEFDEWGNPKQKAYYDYMLSYSPYDNLRAGGYPAMLITSGLWDSQVQYFEPTKYVARLRTLKTDSSPLLLKTDMEGGHGGNSGRYQKYRDRAIELAFILDQVQAATAAHGGTE